MILDEQKAMDVLKNPRSKTEIKSVKNQESQLRVFTEEMSESELKNESYWKEMLERMKSRSEKKFDRVIQFARYPLPVVQLCDSILNDFFKVFEGKNRFFHVDGDRDIKILNEWLLEKKPSKWIEEFAKQVFKNKPNSFVVVDINESGIPYLVFVDSNRLVDAVFKDDDGNLEYIAFIHSQKIKEGTKDVVTTFFSVYDDATYFVFSKDSDSDSYKLVSENKHNIGYCPAKSFIRSITNQKNKFKRRVAFSSALSGLEDWTMFDIFRNYVDHYAPFPVTEAPKRKCVNPECQDGKVSEEMVVNPATGDTKTTWRDCEACGGSDNGQHIFPGTHIGIKVQSDKSLQDGSGVFKMIFPETDKLKYVPEKLDDLELDIRFKTVGINNMTSEAFNELQVKGSFTSMESILLRTKTELDILYKWIVGTVGKVFYKEIELYVDANFGTEYYLVSEDDLQKRYKTAKDSGLPMEELMLIYIQLIETKYKGNELKIERQKMLLKLDPLPLYSITEAMGLKEKNIIDNFDLTLKINFLNFISKFESENAPITQFGLNLEPYQRIDAIKKTLIIYTNEYIASKQL